MHALWTALLWLTRLPVGRLPLGEPVPLAQALWAFPIAGALVGALGAAAFALCARVPALAAVAALAVMLLATGALHEDGLADTADGLGAGGSRECALEIMRDSRIGTYGTLALIVTFAARGAALAAIGSPLGVAEALVACAALGRACILPAVLLLLPARQDGMAAGLRDRRPATIACGLIVALVIAGVCLRMSALVATVAALVATGLLGLASKRRLGGYTGDVLGACAVLGECASLAAVALSVG